MRVKPYEKVLNKTATKTVNICSHNTVHTRELGQSPLNIHRPASPHGAREDDVGY